MEGSKIKSPGTHKEDLDIGRMNHRPRMNWIKKFHLLKNPNLASSYRASKRKVLEKETERESSSSDKLPDTPL